MWRTGCETWGAVGGKVRFCGGLDVAHKGRELGFHTKWSQQGSQTINQRHEKPAGTSNTKWSETERKVTKIAGTNDTRVRHGGLHREMSERGRYSSTGGLRGEMRMAPGSARNQEPPSIDLWQRLGL